LERFEKMAYALFQSLPGMGYDVGTASSAPYNSRPTQQIEKGRPPAPPFFRSTSETYATNKKGATHRVAPTFFT
jgi:hypothetical protein